MKPMEVEQQQQQPQPHRQSEKTIFERCVKDEARNFRIKNYGTVIQPYEFSCSQNGELGEQHGSIYYSNKAITFAGNKEEGFVSAKVQKRAATFVVQNELPLNQLNAIGLNPEIDIGIVKTHGVAYNREIGRTVIAYAHSPQSVHSWLHNLHSSNNQGYIPIVLRDSIRNLYETLERLWGKNMTVDDVQLSGTYALNGNMMHIKPSHVRERNLGDARRPMRGLADMILNNILNRWANDVELRDFHQFLLNPNIRKEDVLNHPFLGDSPARESMYTKLYGISKRFTDGQKDWLNNNINTQGWQVKVDPEDPHADFGFREIMAYQKKYGGFKENTMGALHFAKVSISHYHEHDPNGRHLLDARLKALLPGLLTRVYGATFDQHFKGLR